MCCMFVLKSVWVSTDRLVTESGPIGLGVRISVLTHSTCVEHLIFAWSCVQDHLRGVARWNYIGVGRPAWDFSHFFSILYILFLKSNNHQNLWNSLMLVKIDVLWSWKHEIRRNVGGRNHWKRLPTVDPAPIQDTLRHQHVTSLSLIKVLGPADFRCGVVLQGLRVFMKSSYGLVSSLCAMP